MIDRLKIRRRCLMRPNKSLKQHASRHRQGAPMDTAQIDDVLVETIKEYLDKI